MSAVLYMHNEVDAEMYIGPQRLHETLYSNIPLLLLDCRPADDFSENHIRGAMNITIPASVIMLRRVVNGTMNISSIIRGALKRQLFISRWKTHWIVLYDYDSQLMRATGPCVLSTLYRRLKREGCRVVCLQGGLFGFKHRYPEWLESDPHANREDDLSLENLRIAPLNGHDAHGICDSGVIGEPIPYDSPFPVEILPYLFLGNAENSTDLVALQRHNIRYVLNVTPNLPNAFQDAGLGIKYMKIPIQDHWSQNLSTYFADAVAFIGLIKKMILIH